MNFLNHSSYISTFSTFLSRQIVKIIIKIMPKKLGLKNSHFSFVTFFKSWEVHQILMLDSVQWRTNAEKKIENLSPKGNTWKQFSFLKPTTRQNAIFFILSARDGQHRGKTETILWDNGYFPPHQSGNTAFLHLSFQQFSWVL